MQPNDITTACHADEGSISRVPPESLIEDSGAIGGSKLTEDPITLAAAPKELSS